MNWIPLSKKSNGPDPWSRVLVTDGDKIYVVEIGEHGEDGPKFVCVFSEGLSDETPIEYEDITHWMPLPALPS